MAGRQGSRTWFFPDGDIPPAGDPPQGHESLIMLNPGDTDAEVVLTVYFEDREPEETTGIGRGTRKPPGLLIVQGGHI